MLLAPFVNHERVLRLCYQRSDVDSPGVRMRDSARVFVFLDAFLEFVL